jgi:hypothetical protein|tara:strand:- start:12 stop:305 length:294 start_codon:yes stop_codon:yes gene_type:complete
MAATITWSQHGYYAETTGKKLVTKIKWKCTAVEGSSTAFEEGVMDLDRQSQDEIDDVSVFATNSNLIAVVKARLGDDRVSDIEARVTAGLSNQWYTT